MRKETTSTQDAIPASTHKYGDRNASWQEQSAQDDNWGLPAKKLSAERIAQLNAQARREGRLPPLYLLPQSFVVMLIAALYGLYQTWDLNPEVLEERMVLAEYCGSSVEVFGASLASVALNYSCAALAGCLSYILPCFVAHFVNFGHDLLGKELGTASNESTALASSVRLYRARMVLMRTIWAEVCKFASMFVLLGLFFKYNPAAQSVIICSFAALIVLSSLFSIVRMLMRQGRLSPEGAAALAAANSKNHDR